jgi:hypothetical protein
VASIAVIPSCSSSNERALREDPEAREIAEAFAKAMIETGWDEARAYLSSSGPVEEHVDRSHDFFVSHEFVIAEHAQYSDKVGLLSGAGYRVPRPGTSLLPEDYAALLRPIRTLD